MSQVYFNEFDKFAAQWLRNLYPDAHVDERDIRDVKAEDVAGFERVHFFGGIGGWQLALDLAGWSGPVWTGSCPCQPFSQAGKRKGTADERHLWPEFRRLVTECQPATVIGEQVASKSGREWLTRVFADLEELGYAVAGADLCAPSVGAPHIRQRLFWVAISDSRQDWQPYRHQYERRREIDAEPPNDDRMGNADRAQLWNGRAVEREQRGPLSSERGDDSGLVHPEVNGRDERGPESNGRDAGATGDADRLVNAGCTPGRTEHGNQEGERKDYSTGIGPAIEVDGMAFTDVPEFQRVSSTWEQSLQQWRDAIVIPCRDGRARRISAQPGDEPLANGIPRDLGRRFPELRSVAKSARSNRVGRLRGYGNAIVPQLAAVFIRSFMEANH